MALASRSPSAGDACTACLAGIHSMCPLNSDPCCCGGDADLDTLFKHQEMASLKLTKDLREEYGLNRGRDDEAEGLPSATPAKPKGDSGYIAPAAWPSTEDIGTLVDPKSTGRKRQARMYPITKGTPCEWAGKKIVLLGVDAVVIGCINSPATDLHHGPDKNTLNNEKASHGIGARENTSIICSDCHNSLHAKHDPLYPDYDRVAQQTEPWMPTGVEYGIDYELLDASPDELFAEEMRRMEDRRRRGKTTRGRKARTQEKGDFDVRDEES